MPAFPPVAVAVVGVPYVTALGAVTVTVVCAALLMVSASVALAGVYDPLPPNVAVKLYVPALVGARAVGP